MGPQTVFGVKKQLGLSLVGYGLVGVGVGFASIPVMADILDLMKKKEYPDTSGLHGAVGGLSAAAFSLGAAVGPLIGGTLTARFNFEDVGNLFAISFVILGIVIAMETVWQRDGTRPGKRWGALPPADEIPLTNIKRNKV